MFDLITTLIVCITVVVVTYFVVKHGVTINMTYTNKDKELTPELPKDVVEEDQRGSIDKVIAEIYDAFDINVDTREDNK